MDRGGAGISDGVVVDRSRRRFATAPRCEIHDDPDDDDLLFDMEYDESDRDRRKRSASADSFRSCHNKNVGGVEFSVDDYDGGGQEQEVGDRSQVARVRSFKLRQEEWYGSLPGHHNSSRHRYLLVLCFNRHVKCQISTQSRYTVVGKSLFYFVLLHYSQNTTRNFWSI